MSTSDTQKCPVCWGIGVVVDPYSERLDCEEPCPRGCEPEHPAIVEADRIVKEAQAGRSR